MIIVGKHIEGISLNPLEYLLDKSGGDLMKFESEEDAKDFLRQNGIIDEDDLNDCFAYEEVIT